MPPVLSAAVAVSMLLSLVLGILTQVIQTGSFLGQWVAPKASLPSITIVATFLAGVTAYFAGLPAVTMTGTTIFYAVMAGVANLLTGSVPGLAVHAHVVVPMQYRNAKMAARFKGVS